MFSYFIILLLSVIITSLITWIITSDKYKKEINKITEENNQLHNNAELYNNIITAISKFKTSIESYEQIHKIDSIEIKNAISTAEKYAKALTTSQNTKGDFGEDLLEQILNFAQLKENIHYYKQYTKDNLKPDFVINMPDNKHLIIDSKTILKNYIEYRQTENENTKKSFLNDLTKCVNSLAKKEYQNITELDQPGFIIMYIPIEGCIDLIYTDKDFKKIVELAISQNIVIVGTSSLLVALKLVTKLWANKKQGENIQNIISTAQNLYNNIAQHAQNLVNLRETLNTSLINIDKELNRFTTKNNGSIFKEAEKLKQYGIEAKDVKSGKLFTKNDIPQEFL